MPQPKQTLANHARYVPLYHLVLIGLLTVLLVHAVVGLIHHVSVESAYHLALVVALLLTAWFARAFALTAQDRLIRLELTLRVQRLAPELAERVADLTPGQFTALRFAGDGEMPGLLREALAGTLARGIDIKKRITDWQGDHLRV